MRFISWNVNGLRAALGKGFVESVRKLDPDFICIQETKMREGQAEVDLPEYEKFFCSAEKKGYSGTAVLPGKSRFPYRRTSAIIPTREERLFLEYEEFFLINVYVPNAQDKLKRIDYRMKWEDDFWPL